jgi:hypothetical protein
MEEEMFSVQRFVLWMFVFVFALFSTLVAPDFSEAGCRGRNHCRRQPVRKVLRLLVCHRNCCW